MAPLILSPDFQHPIRARWKSSRSVTARAGLAVDSQGNVWVTSRLGNSDKALLVWLEMLVAFKMGKSPDAILTRAMNVQKAGPEGGNVTILRPDGSQAPGSPVEGNGLVGPWAAVVDGNDHVWISNFNNPTAGIVELAGCRPEANPPGMKTGDPISPPAATLVVGCRHRLILPLIRLEMFG